MRLAATGHAGTKPAKLIHTNYERNEHIMGGTINTFDYNRNERTIYVMARPGGDENVVVMSSSIKQGQAAAYYMDRKATKELIEALQASLDALGPEPVKPWPKADYYTHNFFGYTTYIVENPNKLGYYCGSDILESAKQRADAILGLPAEYWVREYGTIIPITLKTETTTIEVKGEPITA